MKLTFRASFFLLASVFLFACNDDDNAIVNPDPDPDPDPEIELTGESMEYDLTELQGSGVSGTATFAEIADDGGTLVTVDLDGTATGDSHPAHIHFNTAAEGGGIAVYLNNVDGESGLSETVVTNMYNPDDPDNTGSDANTGEAISYQDLIDFDGYINIHESDEDLNTLKAQGDIGQNDLTGESKEYTLEQKDADGISGTATFEKRVNGEALATLDLEGTPEDGEHPAHIHFNTAAEGGGIALTFTPVNGATGMSKTNISMIKMAPDADSTAIGYDGILDFDGYINVHLSMEELPIIVAQGDIGQNELTGESKEYTLEQKDVDGISGTATFEKRVNGEALATLDLEGTPEDGEHPAHIHFNTAAEGGGIALTFTPVNGATGMSKTNISMIKMAPDADSTAIGYDGILDFDGYINVHLSMEELATIVAQGDIGQNELTGESKVYTLDERDVEGISGTATFEKRVNGEALATLDLEGTPEDGEHPAHIHFNTAAEGGGIALTFTPVNGATGMSKTNISVIKMAPDADSTAIGYDGILDFDGYINVHLSMEELATIVAQGDIGQNELTGESLEYDLEKLQGVAFEASGTATFHERVNDETLVVVTLEDFDSDNSLSDEAQVYIRDGAAGGGGDVIVTLNPIVYANNNLTSMTNMTQLDDGTEIVYSDIADIDAHVDVAELLFGRPSTIVRGDIGSNAEE